MKKTLRVTRPVVLKRCECLLQSPSLMIDKFKWNVNEKACLKCVLVNYIWVITDVLGFIFKYKNHAGSKGIWK